MKTAAKLAASIKLRDYKIPSREDFLRNKDIQAVIKFSQGEISLAQLKSLVKVPEVIEAAEFNETVKELRADRAKLAKEAEVNMTARAKKYEALHKETQGLLPLEYFKKQEMDEDLDHWDTVNRLAYSEKVVDVHVKAAKKMEAYRRKKLERQWENLPQIIEEFERAKQCMDVRNMKVDLLDLLDEYPELKEQIGKEIEVHDYGDPSELGFPPIDLDTLHKLGGGYISKEQLERVLRGDRADDVFGTPENFFNALQDTIPIIPGTKEAAAAAHSHPPPQQPPAKQAQVGH